MSKKLVIRINNLQEKEVEENYDRFVVTTVHWNRIIAAIVATLMAVGLVFWVIFSMTGNSVESQTDQLATAPHLAAAPASSEPDVFKAEVTPDDSVSVAKLPIIRDEESVFAEPLAESREDTPIEPEPLSGANAAEVPVDEMHPDTAAVASAEQLVSEVVLAVVEDVPQANEKELPLFDESPAPAEAVNAMAANGKALDQKKENLAAEIPPQTVAVRASAEVTSQQLVANTARARSDSGSVVNPVRSSGSTTNVIVHSKLIKTAQLTSWVEQKQPRDQLGSVIYLSGDELLRIFLFTEMSGLRGRTLYHDWYLNDKRMAQVKIPVKENELAASSSKFIDQYMLGSWKVIVTDDSGKLYITADFEVKAG